MVNCSRRARPVRIAALGAVFPCLIAAPALATSYADIYDFRGGNSTPADTRSPESELTADGTGHLYGVSPFDGVYGGGAVFRLTPPSTAGAPWTEDLPFSFSVTRPSYIFSPLGKLLLGSAGEIYGTTPSTTGPYGSGTAYRLDDVGGIWQQTLLHGFNSSTDGLDPLSGVAYGPGGLLYGSTTGIIIDSGAYAVSPQGGPDGFSAKRLPPAVPGRANSASFPSRPVPAGSGRFIYTTELGGTNNAGTVDMMVQSASGRWSVSVLYSFLASGDARMPSADSSPPLIAPSGVVYGCGSGGQYNYGAIYQLTPPPQGQTNWTETVLYSFGGQPADPIFQCDITLSPTGGLIGVAEAGGVYGSGAFFALNPPAAAGGAWTETLLHSFGQYSTSLNDPMGAPVPIGQSYYGAAHYGGASAQYGGIYQVTP